MKRKRISAVARSMIYLNREPFDRRRQAPETILWIITVQTPLSRSYVACAALDRTLALG